MFFGGQLRRKKQNANQPKINDSANLKVSGEDSFLAGLRSEKGRTGQIPLEKMRQYKNASIFLARREIHFEFHISRQSISNIFFRRHMVTLGT